MHDEHNHTHEHTHDHGHSHTHEHDHSHEHKHEGAQSGGDMARTLALLRYMLEHNRQHAEELDISGGKLRGEGRHRAAELISEAVHYFSCGNDKLQEAVESLRQDENA